MRLEIKLKSDLCTYSGETFNSYVDTDVVYDDYGLPYIPAKRIKGCIREACLELVDFGIVEERDFYCLFGREGTAASRFSLDNACLENYEQLVDDLRSCPDRQLVNRQSVLELYTYTRTQTAMDENGIVDDKTLRNIRVVKHGVKFCADLEVLTEDDKARTEAEDILRNSARMVKHMGVARTRGLGLVELTLCDVKSTKGENAEPKSEPNWREGVNRLSYTITLKSSLLLKSPQGNQARTQDYIEGAKILGVIAGVANRENLSLEDVIVSNAYPVCIGKRCVPVPASIQKKKDQTYDAEGVMSCVDMLAGYTGTAQMTPVGSLYMNADHVVEEVDSEINYHHRRPGDKSIGRATGGDDSAFYQMESLRSGQIFRGYIFAKQKEAKTIWKILREMKRLRLGYGRNAEYGRVELAVDVEGTESDLREEADQFALYLDAPMILCNDYGMITADVSDLTEYLCRYLNVESGTLQATKMFLNYERIGGFNVTWNHRKPSAVVLGKGSVVLYQTKNKKMIDMGKLSSAFIGERIGEGYGEVHAVSGDKISEKFELRKRKEEAVPEKDADTGIISELKLARREKELERAARKSAENVAGTVKKEPEADAVVAKLLLLARTEKKYADLENEVKQIETESKKKLAGKILKEISRALSFEDKKQGQNMIIDEQNKQLNEFEIFLNAYLKELKYLIRPSREERIKGNE